MCAIAGEIRFDGQCPDLGVVDQMNNRMARRGPDSFGIFATPDRAFAHRRLKIMDLSEAAAQPMLDPALGLGIVFNGAIYNHLELRRELEGMGYHFYSRGDTEVLLKAYHAWGRDFVKRLNGMFAFALWERDSGRVLLGRDRLGIKPLYFAEISGGLRFASTLPALLLDRSVDTSIDPIALNHYLSFHAVVPAPYTLFKGISKLPPATVMAIEPDAKDPRAGEKLAWNYKYGVNWGDGAIISPFYWQYRNMQTGKLEKQIKWDFHFLNFMHRTKDAPIPEFTPNPSGIFRAIYTKAHEPSDLKNTQLLIQRFEDDAKLDDAYLYLGFQRRVRRLAQGQATDSFLGSDLMIEDFEGYNGRVSDMKWTYKGTKNVLLPMWNHNDLKLATDMPAEPDGYKYVAFGGQGECFFQGEWQLRKVYVLEAAPVNPNHPVSKRTFYMDVQLQNLNGANEIYDRKGELWKVFMVGKSHADHHLPVNKGAGIGVDDAFSMVDLQSKHCTTGMFKGQVDPAKNPPRLFQVQNLRGGD